MKKYLFLLVAFVAFMSSCSNDDIGSSYTKDEHYYETFTYNVNTQPAFDEFDATSYIKSRFLSGELGSYQIGVYTFIYDKNGDLKESKVSYSQTFGTETYEFTLEDGTYTAVSVEMLVDKDDNYMSSSFEIKGQEKLSTLEIAYRTYKDDNGKTKYYSTSLWYESIGVSTKTITVEKSMSSVTAVPAAIGVVVECEFFNFDNSYYDVLSLFTKDAPIGRYLDPAKSGSERFKYNNYNDDTTVTGRARLFANPSFEESEAIDVYLIEEGNDVSCKLGAGIIENDRISYKYDTSAWNIFEDGKLYYAGLYYIGGTIGHDCDGGIFDNLTDYRSWYNSVKTSGTSTPLTSLTEPFIVWGSSVSTVQSNMTGYTLEIGSAGKAEANGSGSYRIAYSAEAPIFAIYYYFNSQTTGLYDSDVFYYKSSASQNQILQLLNRKYTYITDNEGTYFYMTNNGESYVVLMDLDDYWIVGYVDPSSLSGSSAPAFESMKREMEGRIHKILPSLTKAEKVVSTLSISDNVKDKRICRIK